MEGVPQLLRKRGRSRTEAARFLTEHYFSVAPGTLANKAAAGDGPAFRLVAGRVEYDEADLRTWAESQISRPVRCRRELVADDHIVQHVT